MRHDQQMDDAVDPAGMISTPAAPVGRRRRIAARTRLGFWFDAVLLLGFTLAYSYGFTGIAIHEWLGIGLGAALRFRAGVCSMTTGECSGPGQPPIEYWSGTGLLKAQSVPCSAS